MVFEGRGYILLSVVSPQPGTHTTRQSQDSVDVEWANLEFGNMPYEAGLMEVIVFNLEKRRLGIIALSPSIERKTAMWQKDNIGPKWPNGSHEEWGAQGCSVYTLGGNSHIGNGLGALKMCSVQPAQLYKQPESVQAWNFFLYWAKNQRNLYKDTVSHLQIQRYIRWLVFQIMGFVKMFQEISVLKSGNDVSFNFN